MPLPAGISTVTVTVSPPQTWFGGEAVLDLTVTPTHSLTHVESGTPLVAFAEKYTQEGGVPLTLSLPHTDQTGFVDHNGATFTGWAYTFRGRWSKDGQTVPFVKHVQLPTTITAPVDLDVLPPGRILTGVSATVPVVATLEGMTGAVTLEDLGLDKVISYGKNTMLAPVLAGEYAVNLVDTVENAGIAAHIDHYGVGIGFDIRNRPGAGMAFVLHQYNNSTGVRLDNIGTGPMLVIAQTHNEILNPASLPDSNAAGDAFRQVDKDGNIWAKLDGRGAIVLTPPADQTSDTLRIIGNASTRQSVRITHNGASHGAIIEQGAGAADFYPVLVNGLKYGGEVNASSDGGRAFRVRKTGAGSGTALAVINDGTGATVTFGSTAAQVKSQINPAGEYEHTVAGAGVILKSPNGTRFRVTVDDDGALSTTSL